MSEEIKVGDWVEAGGERYCAARELTRNDWESIQKSVDEDLFGPRVTQKKKPRPVRKTSQMSVGQVRLLVDDLVVLEVYGGSEIAELQHCKKVYYTPDWSRTKRNATKTRRKHREATAKQEQKR